MPDAGGWIRLQKSLREDPRTWRIARALRDRHGGVTPITFYVTLVLGGLAVLWMHGDTFAGDDDSLGVTLEEVNELTGIEGFAQLLPADWLEVLDGERVKLPDFHDHNGSIARRRALDAKRSARYRDRQRDAIRDMSVTAVTPSREHPRPDHSIPDQTKPKRGNGGEPETALQHHGTLPKDSWAEWLTYRRKRRFPVDATTLGKHLAKLAPYPTEVQRQMIDTSIGSGWQGIFDPKGHAAKPHTAAQTTAEAEAEAAAREGITVEELRRREDAAYGRH